jgi:hypothetical protein
MTASL